MTCPVISGSDANQANRHHGNDQFNNRFGQMLQLIQVIPLNTTKPFTQNWHANHHSQKQKQNRVHHQLFLMFVRHLEPDYGTSISSTRKQKSDYACANFRFSWIAKKPSTTAAIIIDGPHVFVLPCERLFTHPSSTWCLRSLMNEIAKQINNRWHLWLIVVS